MAVKARRTQITVKDTSASLAAANKIFEIDTIIIESDTSVSKRADGVTAYNSLTDITGEKVFTQAEKTKLTGIATGATANSTDAQLRDRSLHTGNMPATNVTESSAKRFVTDTEKGVWNAKQAALVSGSNIKTINSTSLLGSTNITLAPLVGNLVPEVNLPPFELMDRVNPEYLTAVGADPATSLLSLEWSAMDSLIRGGYSAIIPVFASSAPTVINLSSPTVSGLSARFVDPLVWWGQQSRHGYVTTAVTQDRSLLRIGTTMLFMPIGFRVKSSFVMGDANAGKNFFQGMLGTASDIGSPVILGTSNLAMIAIGIDPTDTTLRIFTNDASTSTPTKLDLGINYPMNTSMTDVYEWELWVKAGIRTLNYKVVRKNYSTGAIVNQTTGTITTNLPLDTRSMGFHSYLSNNNTLTIMTAETGITSFRRLNP